MADRLTGYRTEAGHDYSASERLLLRQQQENAGLIRLFRASEDMKEWLDSPKGMGFQAEAERGMTEALAVMLNASDTTTTEYRDAHFKVCVIRAAVEMVTHVVTGGEEPKRLVQESDSKANAETNE